MQSKWRARHSFSLSTIRIRPQIGSFRQPLWYSSLYTAYFQLPHFLLLTSPDPLPLLTSPHCISHAFVMNLLNSLITKLRSAIIFMHCCNVEKLKAPHRTLLSLSFILLTPCTWSSIKTTKVRYKRKRQSVSCLTFKLTFKSFL